MPLYSLSPAKSGRPLCADALVCFTQRCFRAPGQQHGDYLCISLSGPGSMLGIQTLSGCRQKFQA